MSNTPNPRKPRQARFLAAPKHNFKIWRDDAGNIRTRRGFLPRADYERLREENAGAGLPAVDALPIV